MSNSIKNRKQFSRRSFIPILGSSLLLPFFGFGENTSEKILDTNKEEDYQTLLKPDGTTVKVKRSTLKKSKVIKKNISNSSFLNWIGRKL